MSGRSAKKKKRNPLLRRPAEQVELPLPPPPGPPLPVEELVLAWWQKPTAVASLAAVALLLVVLGIGSQLNARRDRALAAGLEARVKTLTLRASTAARALRIAPNPRSWSATPDASIGWPEPPLMLDVYLPVGYSKFTSFALTIDKVDQGRMLTIQRMTPDSNHELSLSLNSSAFGPGEYRILLQGYDWRGQRSDTGWVRLVIED
jgi:hypothetical protein